MLALALPSDGSPVQRSPRNLLDVDQFFAESYYCTPRLPTPPRYTKVGRYLSCPSAEYICLPSFLQSRVQPTSNRWHNEVYDFLFYYVDGILYLLQPFINLSFFALFPCTDANCLVS